MSSVRLFNMLLTVSAVLVMHMQLQIASLIFQKRFPDVMLLVVNICHIGVTLSS